MVSNSCSTFSRILNVLLQALIGLKLFTQISPYLIFKYRCLFTNFKFSRDVTSCHGYINNMCHNRGKRCRKHFNEFIGNDKGTRATFIF